MKSERLLSEITEETLRELIEKETGIENVVPEPNNGEPALGSPNDFNITTQRTESKENCQREAKSDLLDDSNKQLIELRRSRSNEKKKHVFSNEALNSGFYKKFFKQKRLLGKGSFGITYECDHVLDKFVLGTYAVKVISLLNIKANVRALLKEIKLMDILEHPNIIGFRHAWVENYQLTNDGPSIPYMFISMEFASEGNLYNFIIDDSKEGRQRRAQEMSRLDPPVNTALGGGLGPHTGHKCLEEVFIWKLFQDLTMALHYIHIKGVCHRDIKPENILLSKTIRRVKRTSKNNWEPEYHSCPKCLISDFGAAILLDKDGIVIDDIGVGTMDDSFGSCHFSGPEVREANWTTKADIWSLGLVLYFMAFARVPFEQISSRSVMYQCLNKGNEVWFPYNHRRSPEIVQLIKRMTSRNPDNRPSSNQLNRLVMKIVMKLRQQNQPTIPNYDGDVWMMSRSIDEEVIEHGYENYLDLSSPENRKQPREHQQALTSPLQTWSPRGFLGLIVEELGSSNPVVNLPMLEPSPSGAEESMDERKY